ncbi:MAG: VWA domain-containing protein, partial [Terriglobia bacterium]
MVRNRAAGIVCVLFAFSVSCAAQVFVPVVVTDSTGSPVRGLERADFMVEPSKKLVLGTVAEVDKAVETDAARGPVFVLFDALSVGPPLQGRAQQRVLELLEKTATNEERLTLVMNTGEGLRLIHDSTTDFRVLRAALQQVRTAKSSQTAATPESNEKEDPEFARNVAAESARLRQLNGDNPAGGGLSMVFRQLAGLQQMALSLQRVAGRKTLIWITAHFPIEIDAELSYGSMSSGTHPELRDLAPAWEQSVEALNSAHVSVYAVQVEGPSPRDPIFEYAQRTQYGLEEFAKSTAGQSFRVGADFVAAIRQAREDCG